MRVFKKISTPFTKSNPDKAIIVVNYRDPQLNTVKSFIQACNDTGVSLTVFVNKYDSKEEYDYDLYGIRTSLGLKDIQYGSAKTGMGMKKLKTYLKLWSGKRIIILGVFNSGKTSIINKLCGTKYKVGDIPGTTLRFTETSVETPWPCDPIEGDTIVIDSVGQLIDINKPLMVSIDYSKCSDIEEKIRHTFNEEILGLVNTKETVHSNLASLIDFLRDYIKAKKPKIIVTGAGASALVAKEIAGQGTECGLPIMCFTNDGAEIQPVTFSKGLGENEGGISKYISNAVNKDDIVIAVSASGGTGFTFDLLRRAKDKGAMTIAITENIDTPLGKYADMILKSDAKPEGPSSSKIQTAHLVIGHTLILVLADELGITADESVGYMLPEYVESKLMGIK